MSRRRLLAIVIGGSVLLVGAFVGVVLATSGSSSDELVLYSARSHYGEEKPFEDFAKKEGIDLTIRGGSASELYERLRSEGSETPADILITVDAANLWRAKDAGIIDSWEPLTLRARTIMRSTERVGPDDVTTYEGLGDPRWKDKLCLRSGTSEYNVSFVADRIAKDGRAATERMLRAWMANDPKIFGSDTDVLEAIEDGDCDVGLTNSYYLGRELADDPDFPVAPVWADQQGRGTHVNLSGLGVVKSSDHAEEARKLIAFLRRPAEQEVFAQSNYEFPAVAGVKPSPVIARFGSFKRDPIDVDGAGPHLDDALQLMDEVGWD
jgi:iron(III) transport system substrate-binding protein